MFTRAAFAAFLLFAAPIAAAAAERPTMIVFDTEFIDLMASGTGRIFTTAEEVERARAVSDAFREALADKYNIIRPAEDSPPFDLSCPDCILNIAQAQGADLVLTSALSRANLTIIYLKYQLGDVAKDETVVSGTINLNGFTERQIRFAAEQAIKTIMTGGTTEQGAVPR